MGAEQEKWLIQRLKEGIEVKDLFPHAFLHGFVYYDIFVHGERTSVVVEVKREKLNHSNEEPLKMKITRVFQIVRGDPKEIKDTTLKYRHIIFVSEKPKYKTKDQTNPFVLNGKIFLQ